jgi:ABC-type branched-subunit amino acid transport system substrate-binding protein
MLRKIVAVLIVVSMALVGVLVPGCGGTPTDGEIEIGGIFCLTGALEYMGVLVEKGALLAVEEINAAGGVLGKNLTLLSEDSNTNPATAFDAYEKLVEVDGVETIVGPMISGAVMASGNYASVMQVPMVSPSAPSPLITDTTWTQWALRTCTTDYLQGAALANKAINEGYDTAAILVQDTPYGIGIELVVTDILEDAGKAIVETIRYEEGVPDYLTELQAIQEASPDVIIQVGYYDDSAVVYEDASNLGLNTIPWLVAEGVYGLDADLHPAAAAFMAEALLLGCTLSPDPELPAYVAFVNAYEARWGEPPSVYCDTVYDAVQLIALAIEDAGDYDGAAIKDSLYDVGVGYSGASGPVTFDANGDRVSATYGIWELQYNEGTGEYEYVILEYISF